MLKAIVEINKSLVDLEITAIDHLIHLMALGEALSRFDGRFGSHFQRCLEEEKNRHAESRQTLQTVSEQLKKVIQTLEPPMGPVN